MQNPASLSDLSSVVNTDVPEPKTPVGAIAGGKFFVKLLTLRYDVACSDFVC